MGGREEYILSDPRHMTLSDYLSIPHFRSGFICTKENVKCPTPQLEKVKKPSASDSFSNTGGTKLMDSTGSCALHMGTDYRGGESGGWGSP